MPHLKKLHASTATTYSTTTVPYQVLQKSCRPTHIQHTHTHTKEDDKSAHSDGPTSMQHSDIRHAFAHSYKQQYNNSAATTQENPVSTQLPNRTPHSTHFVAVQEGSVRNWSRLPVEAGDRRGRDEDNGSPRKRERVSSIKRHTHTQAISYMAE